MKCRPRQYTETGRVTLEMPQDDYWAGYTAFLEAFGVREKGPVPDEKAAQEIARIALRRYRDIAAQAVENGKRGGKKRD